MRQTRFSNLTAFAGFRIPITHPDAVNLTGSPAIFPPWQYLICSNPSLLLAKPTSRLFYCHLPMKCYRDDVVSSPSALLSGAVSSHQPCTLCKCQVYWCGLRVPVQPTQTLRVSSMTLVLCETPTQLLTSRLGPVLCPKGTISSRGAAFSGIPLYLHCSRCSPRHTPGTTEAENGKKVKFLFLHSKVLL